MFPADVADVADVRRKRLALIRAISGRLNIRSRDKASSEEISLESAVANYPSVVMDKGCLILHFQHFQYFGKAGVVFESRFDFGAAVERNAF